MSLTDEQQAEHVEVMTAICRAFRKKNLPMVLKGGTALKLCYNLDRFSEDLDFDCAKALDLEKPLKEVFAQLGKSKAHLRNPDITIKKNTSTARRYRIVYAGDVTLKLETSLRGTPDDNDLIECDGIRTYKIGRLIKQKLGALKGRTAARDLHDVVYLYKHYRDDFSDDDLLDIKDLYDNQSEILDEYNAAYNEDAILSTSDLLHDLSKIIDLYTTNNPD